MTGTVLAGRPPLLERDAERGCLDEALRQASSGAGSVVLIAGEAGIGKTSLVRSFVDAQADRARILLGACDDLVTPRPLGPLRDAARRGGPLAAALGAGDRDGVLSALLGELAAGPLPAVLVVEDVHWADDATLDVLAYVGRRMAEMPAVLAVTYRDGEIGPSLQRVLGGLRGPHVRRLSPARLSRLAVARLAGGTAATSAPLYRLTGGNPFFVSEMVAAAGSGEAMSGDAVPATVVDAVLARVQRLEPAERDALEQLSVVPSGVDLPLARILLDDLRVLTGAERAGLLEVRPDAVAFRHELSRRAVEAAQPVAVRMQRNARVLAALLDGPEPDLARVVHHAVAAGDDAAVIAHAPAAARAAHRLGASVQEAALQEQALDRSHLLDAGEEAALWQERTATLFSLGRLTDALGAGLRAVRLCEDHGDPARLAAALTELALVHWALATPRASLAAVRRAVGVLEPDGDGPQHAHTLAYLGGLLGSVDRDTESLQAGTAARAMAGRLGVPHLVALGDIACGTARLKLGDPGGVDDLAAGIAAAAAAGAHVIVMTGYGLLVQDLWNTGRHAETDRWVDEAVAYARDRDLSVYLDHVSAYGLRLRAQRGEWEVAECGLRRLDGTAETGSVRHSLPALARLLVRRGADDTGAVLERAWAYVLRTDSRYPIVPAAMAWIEHAWLTGQPAAADTAVAELATRTAVPGAEHARADLARWLRRLGRPAEPFPGCPYAWAAGLRGDWRAAAQAFAEHGMPYEQALELIDADDTGAVLDGLAILDDLGARPAAALVRRRLRERGIDRIPRGPTPETRANPAGLTERQVEILRLVAAGRTNAEIAATLVLSVRTVDHHVSAVLQKLGITGRREVRAAAARHGLA